MANLPSSAQVGTSQNRSAVKQLSHTYPALQCLAQICVFLTTWAAYANTKPLPSINDICWENESSIRRAATELEKMGTVALMSDSEETRVVAEYVYAALKQAPKVQAQGDDSRIEWDLHSRCATLANCRIFAKTLQKALANVGLKTTYHEGHKGSHAFLKTDTGIIIDPTFNQFFVPKGEHSFNGVFVGTANDLRAHVKKHYEGFDLSPFRLSKADRPEEFYGTNPDETLWYTWGIKPE